MSKLNPFVRSRAFKARVDVISKSYRPSIVNTRSGFWAKILRFFGKFF